MSANSDGGYPNTPEADMRAFDQLPATARQALANAAPDFASQPWLTRFRRRKTSKEIAKAITTAGARPVAEWENQRLRGSAAEILAREELIARLREAAKGGHTPEAEDARDPAAPEIVPGG